MVTFPRHSCLTQYRKSVKARSNISSTALLRPAAKAKAKAKAKAAAKAKGKEKTKAAPKAKGKAKAKAATKKGKLEKELDAAVGEESEKFSLTKEDPQLWTDSDEEKDTKSTETKGKSRGKGTSESGGALGSDDADVAEGKGKGKNGKGKKRETKEQDTKEDGRAEKKIRKKKGEQEEKAKKGEKEKVGSKPEQDDTKERATRPKQAIDQPFQHSWIVPYRTRKAVALKVRTGEGKSGLTQARKKLKYVSCRIGSPSPVSVQVCYLSGAGKTTDDLIQPISTIVSWHPFAFV